jgi:hypothetical protein
MGLDIRLPLGLMFLITGGLMTGYGLFTRGSEIYMKSEGININLYWGLLMLVFGLIMYLLGRTPRIGKLPPHNPEPVPPLPRRTVGH